MENIAVENIWSNPKENAYFLDWCNISVQVRNISDKTIRIEKVECLFDTEDDGIFAPCSAKPQEIMPKQRSSPISIEFEASLSLKAYTNSYKMRIRYQQTDESIILDYDPRKYIVLYPRGSNEKFFFISHKDPEDIAVARRLREFLWKLV